MSREILFKAKRLSDGEWVEGYYFERRNTCGEIIASVIISDAYEQVAGGVRYFRSNLNYECFKVDPSTLCQYTGLTDKNGKKIWENDICDRKERFKEIVKMQKGDWVLDYGYAVGKEDCYCNLGFYVCERKSVVVIGNVFDNPELLEGHK